MIKKRFKKKIPISQARAWAQNENERPSMAEIALELQRITGIVRPDFVAMEAQIKKELMVANNLTNKSHVRKNKAQKGRLPKGM